MKRILSSLACSLCLLLLTTAVATAQTTPAKTVVQGKVVEADKSPVHNVTVAEVDADGRTIKAAKTDVDGNFSIAVASTKHRLSFSHISFKSVDFAIGSRTTFNVTLESNSKDMGAVVVSASRKTDNGMVTINERDLTTAQSRINARDLEEMQAASIDQALQGRVSGVDIAAPSGDPGQGMQIRIRGTSSINSSVDPLIVVDGMPYETSIPSDFNFGTADDVGYAQLLNIAPSDIRDITILKDAAATAVWGSRAANGVIVINTKRGSIGKPSLTYTFKGSITKQPDMIPMLNGNQYSTLIPEEYMNANGTPLNTQSVKEFQYDPNDPYWFYNYSNNTDWIKSITQLGYAQDHNISMTGGGEKARYFASLGYFNQKGTTIGTDLSRLNTRINLDYIVSQRIRFKSDLSFSYTDNNRNFADNLRDIAYRKMPNMGLYEYDEYGNYTGNYFSPAFNVQGQYNYLSNGNINGTLNPLALAKNAKNNILTQRVTPHFNLSYDIKPRVLQATFDVQFDINNTVSKSFLPQNAVGLPWNDFRVNRAYNGDLDVFNVQTKTNLIFTPQLKNINHELIAFASFNTYDNKTLSQQMLTTNTAADVLQDPTTASRTNGGEQGIASSTAQTRSIGILLNAQYKFKDRYMINAGIRTDGNSRFGPANRFGYFPSVSLRWRASDEKFLQGLKTKYLDDLSFRASYGQSGNAPKRDYSFYSQYNTFSWTYLGQSGVYPSNMELTNLRWETIQGVNAGLNVVTHGRRFTMDVEIYRNRTLNMFFPGLQISSITGFNSVDMNVGTMDNRGFEVSLNATPLKNKTWQWDVSFNIARNENIIREISDLYPRDKGNLLDNGNYKTYMQVDNPFGSFYGFRYKGVYKDQASTVARDAGGKPIVGPTGQIVYMKFNYPSINYQFQPGDAIYEDINHDGNINYQDVVYLGNSNPKFTGGFGTTLAFKGQWRLSTFFNYRYKYQVVNGTKMYTSNMYGFDNQSTAVLRRWRKEGDETDIPRALYRTGFNWLGSDRYVEDASFLRFRTVTLRYTAPKKFADKLKIKNLSAYVTVENLYTWTNYTGQDPEITVRGSDPFRVAQDNSLTPPVKTFTLGLTAGF